MSTTPRIATAPFGRTGHQSTRILFGAAALWTCDQATADRVLDLLLDYGINHIDTAPAYGDAEIRIGLWMDRHRRDFFLATKTRARDGQGAREDLHRSLDRLRTDHVDLWQFHALAHPDHWDTVFGDGGALETALQAKAEGLIRHIGVTGHGWTIAAMHRRSLAAFDFDSILMPWNWFAANHVTYADDFREVLDIARSRNVAVQTIKSIARGPWAAGSTKTRQTWYQPLEDETDIREAVHWVLSEPGIFLNSAGDTDLLPLVLNAAASHDAAQQDTPPDVAVMNGLQDRTGLSSIFGL